MSEQELTHQQKGTEHMLSTADNPYNPFKHFDEWNQWDQDHGYHTLSFLARLVKTSTELSEEDQSLALETAIDEIVQENLTGNYIKVTEDS